MAAVALQQLVKTFGEGLGGGGRSGAGAAVARALKGVSLDVAAGELMALLGPSGCGKSTVLRCIAGLERPTSGRILVDGVDVTDTPPQDRDIAMVFQNYALYPHMTVRGNIGFPLRMRGRPKDEVARRVDEVARMLGLAALLARRPAELSGGERQRVALGRAIVRQPKVFLMDEPLSNLDARLRASMRAELLALHRSLGATMIFVTHDQVEAMTMGRRIAVLDQGEVQQIGTPREIYQRPATVFVAQFIGSPGMNMIGAPGRRGTGAQDDVAQRHSGNSDAALPRSSRAADMSARTGAQVGFRPEEASLVAPESGRYRGRVRLIEPLGGETLVHVVLPDDVPVIVRVRGSESLQLDQEVGVAVPDSRLHHFSADGARLT